MKKFFRIYLYAVQTFMFIMVFLAVSLAPIVIPLVIAHSSHNMWLLFLWFATLPIYYFYTDVCKVFVFLCHRCREKIIGDIWYYKTRYNEEFISRNDIKCSLCGEKFSFHNYYKNDNVMYEKYSDSEFIICINCFKKIKKASGVEIEN